MNKMENEISIDEIIDDLKRLEYFTNIELIKKEKPKINKSFEWDSFYKSNCNE